MSKISRKSFLGSMAGTILVGLLPRLLLKLPEPIPPIDNPCLLVAKWLKIIEERKSDWSKFVDECSSDYSEDASVASWKIGYEPD